jgi:hypothetical protein
MAATIGTSGGEIIAAPSQVTNTEAFNTIIQAFDEQQDVTLVDDLAVDGGTISAGTIVDSHMIFLNAENNTPGLAFGLAGTPAVTFTFDGVILGVMSDREGNLEAASTPILGASGSTYEAPFAARGMESNDFINQANDWYIVSGNTISLGMNVTQPGDWIRVVTAAPIPTPAAGLLLPVALGGMAALRRRKNRG